MSDLTIEDLSPAQRKMLLGAAGRPKLNRRGLESHYVWIGSGQASTAKKLESLGLGAYDSNGYSARFWVWTKGYELAATVGVTPRPNPKQVQ